MTLVHRHIVQRSLQQNYLNARLVSSSWMR